MSRRRPSREDLIAAAEAGDHEAGSSLLRAFTDLLEAERPVPPALREYMVRCFRRILGDPETGTLVPDTPRASEIEALAGLAEVDPIDALHLRRRGGRPRIEESLGRRLLLEHICDRLGQLKKQGQSYDERVDALARELGVSRDFVKRAPGRARRWCAETP